MGLYDRDYSRANVPWEQDRPSVKFTIGLTPVVKWLIITNVAIYVPYFMFKGLTALCLTWFPVFPINLGTSLQVWRWITYQFLHDPEDMFHIFFNMICLFFFGPMFERKWGSKKFLIFYLICGAMGGVLYTLLIWIGFLKVPIPLIGASGAILGLIAAAAILYPRMKVYVLGIFPVPIMILASILAIIGIMTVVRRAESSNAGGEAAHLAGMATGAVYVLSESWRANLKTKTKSDRWQRKKETHQNLQEEVDRILQKVHNSGIHSLTSKEKKILQKATKTQQMRNKF